MAVVAPVPPNLWMQVGGIWVRVAPIYDPLLRCELHRVTVDWREGHIRVHVAGNNAGSEWSTSEPSSHDFMTTDGSPL
jgi:hypothetical protein